MLADRFFEFRTKKEAFAFVDGVEWVNDGSIDFIEVSFIPRYGMVEFNAKGKKVKVKPSYCARFLDNDKPEVDSDSYPMGWSQAEEVKRG